MKVLLDIEGADAGTVTFNGQARIAHLAQDHGLDLDRTILANLFEADNDAMRAIHQYEEATQGEDAEALQAAYDAMDRAGAWATRRKPRRSSGNSASTTRTASWTTSAAEKSAGSPWPSASSSSPTCFSSTTPTTSTSA